MRSPQKYTTQPGEPSVWKCEIQGKQVNLKVTPEENRTLMDARSGSELQGLVERIYDRQQQQLDQHSRSMQQQQHQSSITAAATTAATDSSPTKPTPLKPPPQHVSESIMTPASMVPKHSSTPGNAITRHSEVTSPVSVDPDLEDIKERTARVEEDLAKAIDGNPIHKDEGTEQPPKKEDVNDDQETSMGNQETHLKVPVCQDRFHEFEKRTKQYLAVPAKRFAQAYRTCIYHFERKADECISQELARRILEVLIQCYHEVEEVREYCMEVLSEADRRNNPKYDEYMDLKLDQLNECSGLQDQYCERWYHQDSQMFHEPQKHEDEAQDRLKVPQPNEGVQPQAGHAHVYQSSAELPIKSRPPPVVIDKPMEQSFHPIQPKGRSQQQVEPPLVQPQPTGAFQVYKDPSPIPTPTGPSIIYEQTHMRFRLKDELEVIEQFDGSKPREYLRFRVQWGNLDDKMMHTTMSGIDKYNALCKVLTGKARRLIDTKYPDHWSYEKSREKLEKTYYKAKLHVTEVIHSLAKHDQMTDTYESLFNGYNRLKDSWDDLEHLNLSKGQYKGLLLITANEKNLSQGTWTHWNNIQNDPRYAENSMECLNVDAFLGAIQTAMNNAQRKQNVVGKYSTTYQKPKPKSTLYGSYSAAVQSTQKDSQKQAGSGCVFCSRTTHHRYQLYCPALKTLNPEAIWDIMKKNGITCQMCLCTGHNTRDCEPTRNGVLKRCSIKDNQDDVCGKYHCRFLHRAPKKDQSTEAKESKPATKQ